MKTLNLLILALLTPFILTAQTDETNTIGYRAGINLSPILFGEYGFSVERYSGNKSIYFSFAYKTERQFSNMTMDEDFDFNKGTYFYLPSKGFTLRLGYKFELKKLIPNAGFFVMPELIYRQDGFDHFTFYRRSDDYPLEQTYSMCGQRYGGAFKFGWQNSFKKESPIYWELNIAIGALYRKDNFMLYYSRYYTEIKLQELFNESGWMPTYALNFIIGYHFNN